ncbi:glycosyltransferase, partial [Escherichia coli]|nr:glycosyltransferase [Escherichia coli]
MVISEHIQKDFDGLAQSETEKNKIIRVYNPVDTQEILNKSELGKLSHTNLPTFVSVGTVFPQKGFDRLLKVHKRLLDEGL